MPESFQDPFDMFTGEDQKDFFDPAANGHTEETDDSGEETHYVNYDVIMGAPDYATMIKGARGKVAKEYEIKVRSILKAGAIGTLKKGNLPDSAAIFHHGPSFAAAVGGVAEVSESTRRMLDILTAPENPYAMLLIAGISFGAQIIRNHQPEIQEVQRTRRAMKKYRKEHPEEFAAYEASVKTADKRKNVEIKLPLGRRLSFRLGLRVNPLKGIRFAFRTQTKAPSQLVTMVFSDKKLVAALKKMDIDVVQVPL